MLNKAVAIYFFRFVTYLESSCVNACANIYLRKLLQSFGGIEIKYYIKCMHFGSLREHYDISCISNLSLECDKYLLLYWEKMHR